MNLDLLERIVVIFCGLGCIIVSFALIFFIFELHQERKQMRKIPQIEFADEDTDWKKEIRLAKNL